jgi:hypothetical protein
LKLAGSVFLRSSQRKTQQKPALIWYSMSSANRAIDSGVHAVGCGPRSTAASITLHAQSGPHSTGMPCCHFRRVGSNGCTSANGWGCINNVRLPWWVVSGLNRKLGLSGGRSGSTISGESCLCFTCLFDARACTSATSLAGGGALVPHGPLEFCGVPFAHLWTPVSAARLLLKHGQLLLKLGGGPSGGPLSGHWQAGWEGQSSFSP